jgi:hypothetical protein
MSPRIGLLVPAVLALCLAICRAADEPKKDGEPSLGDLAVEVEALRGLYYFKFTPAQMEQLAKFAKETNQKPRPRKGKASKEYVQVLTDLRDALADASNEDLIDNLEDQLDQLQAGDKPQLDDGVEITDAARRRVPEVLRMLKAPQVANYISNVADEVPDPLDRLLGGFEKAGLPENEWKEQSEEIAREVGWLVGGLDKKKAAQIQEQAAGLLARARTARQGGEAELKKEQGELEKAAEKIVGDIGPTQVLHHIVEHTLVELLSNPKLPDAIKARAQ